MAHSHYVGIDVGTGSARACIVDENGDIKGLASKNIQLWNDKHDYYEQSTTDIWDCICYSVKEAMKKESIDPRSIKGIGFDATCSLSVFSLDTDQPISVTPGFREKERNVILWLDHRPVDEVQKINGTNHNLLRYVGGQMSIEMEMPKVLWLKNNMPPELFATCKFYDLTDALTHLATGSETRSFCSTVCKQGYVPVGVDGSVKGWQEDFLVEIGLKELCENNCKRIGGVHGVNNRYVTAGDYIGGLCEKAAQQLGLPVGTAVGSGVIDAYAGWIGTVGAKAQLSEKFAGHDGPHDIKQAFHRLAAVAGTSTCHLAMSPDPVFVPGVWGPYRDVLFPGYWLSEGGQSATGELILHMNQRQPYYEKADEEAKGAGQNIYDYLNAYLEKKRQGEKAPSIAYLGRHFFFYGDLFGNRSPIADPTMKGVIVGLSSDKSIDGLAIQYYATMEFIALQTRQIIEVMNKAGHQLTSIFMSGSQCLNPILMQLIANTCRMPVLIPEYVHAAVCHGAAMLGAKAASADRVTGESKSLWKIMEHMSKPARAVEPCEDEAELRLLDAKYSVFLQMASSQRRYREEVDAATGKGYAPNRSEVLLS